MVFVQNMNIEIHYWWCVARWLRRQYQNDVVARYHRVPTEGGRGNRVPGEQSQFSVKLGLCQSGRLRGILQAPPRHEGRPGSSSVTSWLSSLDKNLAWGRPSAISQVQLYRTFEDKTGKWNYKVKHETIGFGHPFAFNYQSWVTAREKRADNGAVRRGCQWRRVAPPRPAHHQGRGQTEAGQRDHCQPPAPTHQNRSLSISHY